MSTNVKTGSSHVDSVSGGNFYRVAIVGAASLKGKEIAEVLKDRNFPAVDVKLLDDDESLGQLEAVGEEMTFIQKVRAEEFRHVDFSFFASDQDCTRKTWKLARDAGSAIVDLSFALDSEPGAVVRSPWIERQLGEAITPELQPGPAVAADAAATVLALLLLRTQKVSPLKRAIAMAFEPASEQGQKGMDELHEQTVNLLSFQQLPKNIFDVQIAFNMVSRYGDHSATTLASVESRILKHIDLITRSRVIQPSLMVLQAPIFHGHAFALNIEIEGAADIEKLGGVIAGEHVRITQSAEEAPSNVSVAGQGDVQVSIMPDRGNANAFWIWAAADNLRIAATTAVECAETMAATRPRGQIQ